MKLFNTLIVIIYIFLLLIPYFIWCLFKVVVTWILGITDDRWLYEDDPYLIDNKYIEKIFNNSYFGDR